MQTTNLPQAGMDRRSFLKYIGAGAASISVLGPLSRTVAAVALPTTAPSQGPWVMADGTPKWWPVRYPLPQPGDTGPPSTDARRLAYYQVKDELVLPDGYSYDVVAQWGDLLGPTNDPSTQIRFGYNADYTAVVPIPGTTDEYWLVVNHEYISALPWLQGYAEAHGTPLPDLRMVGGKAMVDGVEITADEAAEHRRAIIRAGMDDLGVSIVHVRLLSDGTFEPVQQATDHRRLSGAGQTNIAQGPSFSGPAAALLPADGVGTFANCSGGITPWGTVLTCEENFQDHVAEAITATGQPFPGAAQAFTAEGSDDRLQQPAEFTGLGEGLGEGGADLDGRCFGWVVEIDPATGRSVKHTSLGRFRHENVAIRCEAGKPVACYMGDDRRGGHVWKFVSNGIVTDPKDPANSRLLHEGTLYVARFEEDFTGRWIPLTPQTPLVRPEPHHTAGGFMMLPRRAPAGKDLAGGHVAAGKARKAKLSIDAWMDEVLAWPWGVNATGLSFDQLRLGNLVMATSTDASQAAVERQGVLLMEAFAMANCIGGTPTARPEDVEIHPHDGTVYIAFTDSTDGSDGSPDGRIFRDSKGENSRQYGAIYRLAEADDDPAAAAFTWGKFISSGEAAEGGGGFACADNLVFDPDGNLWMVCDISTASHNVPVTRDKEEDAPGGKKFVGVFGNNAMFMIPTAGPNAGVPMCFAIGPCECELTGPTFVVQPDGGWTLLLAVQHPGEVHGTRGRAGSTLPDEEVRTMKIAARDGTLFEQQRTVPLGSNFPAGRLGAVPRPSVVCITRAAGA